MAHEPGTVLKPLVKLPKDLNNCWTWLASSNDTGTPIKQWNGRPKAARKWIYELLFPKVPDGMIVYGTCGTQDCINPAHIAVGFIADSVRSGHSAVLTPADVAEIRNKARDGVMHAILAEEFGVKPHTISEIIANRTWGRSKKRKPKNPQLRLFK